MRCNKEAGRFNNLLRRHCFWKGKVFFLDHGLQWLPPGRFLAADGIHPSFEGVALIASHLRSVLLRNAAKSVSGWLDHAPRSSSAPTEDLPYHEEFPTIREANENRHRQSTRQLPTTTERGQRRKSPSTTPREYAEAAGGAASGSDD
ncbi:hypothetical protein HPB50_029583 [Hyalomma asiaticum]|nr:hypothetical protein HPB50_029583 [Hyalomma asiaticum]